MVAMLAVLMANVAYAGDQSAEKVAVEFVLDYQPGVVSSASGSWQMFVYLNGEFLMWSDGSKKVDVSKYLPAGRHILRFVREQHTKVKKGWEHKARVCLVPVELELKAGSAWRVELSAINTKGTASDGAVGWKVLRDGEVVDEASSRGGSFREWPQLCEDILANIPRRKWNNSSTREATRGCSEWETLWLEVAGFPDRDKQRQRLEEQLFRPVF